jgi:hypothetical protein
MGRKIFLLNLLILASVVLLARQLTYSWQEYEQSHSLSQVIGEVPAGATVFETPRAMALGPAYGPGEYMVIGDRNLFSPDRRPELAPAAAAPVEQPPAMPRNPTLNGVSTIGGNRQAILTSYDPTSQAQSRQVVGVGDKVQGWTVTEIGDSVVKLQWKDHEKVIDMWDAPGPQPQQMAGRAEAPVTVIRVGAPPAAVETTTPDAVMAEERQGLTIGVAGQAQGVRTTQGGAGGLRGGAAGGRGMTGRGRSGMGGASGAGTMGAGVPIGTGSGVPVQRPIQN